MKTIDPERDGMNATEDPTMDLVAGLEPAKLHSLAEAG